MCHKYDELSLYIVNILLILRSHSENFCSDAVLKDTASLKYRNILNRFILKYDYGANVLFAAVFSLFLLEDVTGGHC